MRIIKGRGDNRQEILTLPGGGFIARGAKDNPKDYNVLLGSVCNLLGIGPALA